MQLPTDPSADDDQSAGAQMMPLNASVEEKYACANAEDTNVCPCKR